MEKRSGLYVLLYGHGERNSFAFSMSNSLLHFGHPRGSALTADAFLFLQVFSHIVRILQNEKEKDYEKNQEYYDGSDPHA